MFSWEYCEIFKKIYFEEHQIKLLLKNQINLIGMSYRPRVFCKKWLLEISWNALENTCARDSFLIKLHAWGLQLN